MSSAVIKNQVKAVETRALVPGHLSRAQSAADLASSFLDFVCGTSETKHFELETSALSSSRPKDQTGLTNKLVPRSSLVERRDLLLESEKGLNHFKWISDMGSRWRSWGCIYSEYDVVKTSSYMGTSSGWKRHLFKNEFRDIIIYKGDPAVAVSIGIESYQPQPW